MTITTKFNVYQRVRIKEINTPATIVEIKITCACGTVLYNCEYWGPGEIKCAWLFERELEEIK